LYNLKKGLNIPISGTPEGIVSDSTKISHVGILGPGLCWNETNNDG
jgi:Na+-transporting NADH:ubiquinone oxidoreductase subunit NqrA